MVNRLWCLLYVGIICIIVLFVCWILGIYIILGYKIIIVNEAILGSFIVCGFNIGLLYYLIIIVGMFEVVGYLLATLRSF